MLRSLEVEIPLLIYSIIFTILSVSKQYHRISPKNYDKYCIFLFLKVFSQLQLWTNLTEKVCLNEIFFPR